MNDVEKSVGFRAFVLWCKPMSYAAIGRALGLDQRTVAKYVREEAARRRDDLAAERDALIEQQAATYQRVRDRQLVWMDSPDPMVSVTAGKVVIAALTALDRLHGLDAVPLPVQYASPLSEALRALPKDALIALFAGAAQRRGAAIDRDPAVDTIDAAEGDK